MHPIYISGRDYCFQNPYSASFKFGSPITNSIFPCCMYLARLRASSLQNGGKISVAPGRRGEARIITPGLFHHISSAVPGPDHQGRSSSCTFWSNSNKRNERSPCHIVRENGFELKLHSNKLNWTEAEVNELFRPWSPPWANHSWLPLSPLPLPLVLTAGLSAAGLEAVLLSAGAGSGTLRGRGCSPATFSRRRRRPSHLQLYQGCASPPLWETQISK